ncbi:uncharacterized protein LOC101862717 [Aplysia californica]|uniref:Uncharacterized protein LOC101862717 n=1 Tax=Aplysia californica TaxID=6500 RepID=A0ABM0ZX34_APLCA|nr:uncharacterized protein LOC101862717 [Aplysia californica]
MVAKDVVAEIGMSPSNNLKVECAASKAWGWTYMSISRYEGDSDFSLEFLGGVEKRDEWPFIPIDSRMSDFTLHRDDEQVTLALETKYAMCEDKGRYLCEAIVNRTIFSKTFNVDVKKKPEPPKLSFPEDIFDGDTIWMTTTWDAGNPLLGHIVHEVIKGYKGLPFAAKNERTISWKKDCSIQVRNKYQVTPNLSWNGTELLVRIIPKENATLYEQNVVRRVKTDRKTVLIIDRNICKGKYNQKVAHPYTCSKYITCFRRPRVTKCGYFQCFNDKSKTCQHITLE